jgi:pilus assembly protein Flp/PilA
MQPTRFYPFSPFAAIAETPQRAGFEARGELTNEEEKIGGAVCSGNARELRIESHPPGQSKQFRAKPKTPRFFRTGHYHPKEFPMRNLCKNLVSFLKNEDGPTAVEYAVMLSLIIVVCIAAITTLGSNANAAFSFVGSNIKG